MKKNLLLLITVVLMSMASAFAQGGTTGPLTWNLNSGTLTISGTGAMPNYDWGGAPWYPYAESIGAVVLENGVATIGNYAFIDCIYFTSITMPNGVFAIGDYAFYGCSALVSVTIPNSITTIGSSAFSHCKALTSINVETGNANYSSMDGVLFDKEKTVLICYPAGKTNSSYIIPNSVAIIGDGAFYAIWNSTVLTSVTIPNSVITIGNSAFQACTALSSITIPNSVTTIGSFAFSDCTTLTSVTIGNSVTAIGWRAFGWCRALISVTIPNSVITIQEGAFYACSALTSIEVESENVNYSSTDGILFDKEKNILICYPAKKAGSSYTIPNSVTIIEFGAFNSCSSLTSITIPNNVTTIMYSAFNGCSALSSITIPNSVTSIGSSAFSFCSALTSVTIPNSVTSIEYYTFGYCTALTSITIPNSVTSIETYAFLNCTALTSVTNLNPEPVEISSYVFQGVDISACTLKVLESSIFAYDTTEVWKDFNIVGIFSLNVSANNDDYGIVTGGGYYDKNETATVAATAFEGYKFINWTKNGVEVSTDNSYSFTVTENIELVANFEEEVGVEKFELINLKIYPNPTTGQLKIESDEMRIEHVEIFDVFGKKVFFQKSLMSTETVINISYLPAGVYFVRIQTEASEVIKKVLKE